MQFLLSFFADLLISAGLWSSYSPDLSPLDFHLWFYLKDKVFRNALATIDELKGKITKEVNKIDNSILKNVFFNFIKRCQACIRADGRHFQQYL